MRVISRILDNQYRQPSGLLGLWIGWRMARDHFPENLWTVGLMDVKPADRILEIGFGPGATIQLITQRNITGKVAGVDSSGAMLRAAARRNRTAIRRGQVDLRHGEAEILPFEDSEFNKVLSVHSVYFWPDPQKAIREIHRVLEPGGRVFLTILPSQYWNAGDPDEPVSLPASRPYAPGELADMLQAAGFDRVWFEDGADPDVLSKYCVIGERQDPSAGYT